MQHKVPNSFNKVHCGHFIRLPCKLLLDLQLSVNKIHSNFQNVSDCFKVGRKSNGAFSETVCHKCLVMSLSEYVFSQLI